MPALSLPGGTTSKLFSFKFVYPSAKLNLLTFNIKQYNNDGQLLNASYHTKTLSTMTDTQNYQVDIMASSTPLHYVVQLTESGEMMRQYPFGVFVSDLDIIVNPKGVDYLFPRLVEVLKQKVLFNYFFAFYDGFYDMFSASTITAPTNALDVSFKSVSGQKQYNMDIKIFSASDALVKRFAEALRPYFIAFLWLSFALYVVIRITHLFSNKE
jgi:hypothetical protein